MHVYKPTLFAQAIYLLLQKDLQKFNSFSIVIYEGVRPVNGHHTLYNITIK